MKDYICLKDWIIDNVTYFKKGNKYKGKPYNNGKSVAMIGESRMEINFHSGSEYFHME